MLAGEPFAGAADAGLDFVEHQEPAALVANLPQSLEVAVIRNLDAAFARDRLDQHGDDALVVVTDMAHGIEIVVRYPEETLHQRFEARLDFAVAARGECRQRAAVETALGDDDAGRADVVLAAIEACEFDRGFVGLGAGVEEKDVVHAGELADPLRQLFLQRDFIPVRSVQQFAGLIADRGGDGRVGVP